MKSRPLNVTPGNVLRSYTPEEVVETLTCWLDVFGKDAHGVDTDAYLWHLFSSGRYRSEVGGAAKEQYLLHVAHEYVVMSNDRKVVFTTDLRPESCSLADYYVFPHNMAWTMAFTHEDGWLGPYFARHPNHIQLERENAARVRKEQAAATAKQKGWR